MIATIVLDENAVRRLQRAIGSDLELLTWIGDWLFHLGFLSDAQVYESLRFMKPAVEKYAAELEFDDELSMSVIVCDSRWISCSGMFGFYDTQTAETVEEMPEPAVTHIMCSVGALRRRLSHRKKRDGTRQQSAEDVDQSCSKRTTEGFSETDPADDASV